MDEYKGGCTGFVVVSGTDPRTSSPVSSKSCAYAIPADEAGFCRCKFGIPRFVNLNQGGGKTCDALCADAPPFSSLTPAWKAYLDDAQSNKRSKADELAAGTRAVRILYVVAGAIACILSLAVLHAFKQHSKNMTVLKKLEQTLNKGE